MRLKWRCVAIAAALAAPACVADLAWAQTYPTRPIRLVTSGVGGNGDITARLIAQGLNPKLGQQLIVDNRPSGFMSGEIVSKAAPDGYTLLVLGSTHWLGSLLQRLSFDAIRDFAPITLVTSTPNILMVTPSLPANSVAELVALAKTKPGALNYGASGTGSSNHLAAELFKYMAKVDVVHVPYKSNAAAMVDLIGGQIHLAFPTAGAAAPFIKSGKLRALAVTTAQPSARFPGLPTVAASGVPGYESESPIGVLAPAGTPASIISRLHRETVAAIQEPALKERFLSMGAETVGNTPAQFAAKINAEVARMSKVIKAAGIRVE